MESSPVSLVLGFKIIMNYRRCHKSRQRDEYEIKIRQRHEAVKKLFIEYFLAVCMKGEQKKSTRREPRFLPIKQPVSMLDICVARSQGLKLKTFKFDSVSSKAVLNHSIFV